MAAGRGKHVPERNEAPEISSADEVTLHVARDAEEIAGLISTPDQTRSGEDTRRRGWFWHWNSIVTQYAPLIGLKGVGLLNSYTVWTDRREESPHRGYAFPSQQREADFYGEDRAELITINKILVALDLIEIRKEMVLRVDEHGRRWKVPHNFYRVMDHDDGSSLTTANVLRVAALAERDAAVYRYVRRVFSPRFAPIDRDNVWVSILAEVRQTDTWRQLSMRAEREEDRASARTRAGHAARKGVVGMPVVLDKAATTDVQNDTDSATSLQVQPTNVEQSNNGLLVDVGQPNNGSPTYIATFVDPVNSDQATDVDQTNTTYDQSTLTTTTTSKDLNRSGTTGELDSVDRPSDSSQVPVTSAKMPVTGRGSIGPGGRIAPEDAPDSDFAFQAFEDANGRPSTPAERRILRGLAERFDELARLHAAPGETSGWRLVGRAVYEAVESGSSYVAPRRLREILSRWERDGVPLQSVDRERGGMTSPTDQAYVVDKVGNKETAASSNPRRPRLDDRLPDISLPHGFGSQRTWAFTVNALALSMSVDRLVDLFEGTGIAGYADGQVTIFVQSLAQADRITGEYRDLVTRKLGEAMRRPVRIAVMVSEDIPAPTKTTYADVEISAEGHHQQAQLANVDSMEAPTPNFVVAECGLPSAQVWSAILDELSMSGAVGHADHSSWLRGTRLVGRGENGSLIVGAAHPLAQRRIASRFGPTLRAAVAGVLGVERPLEIVVWQEWVDARMIGDHSTPEMDAGVA